MRDRRRSRGDQGHSGELRGGGQSGARDPPDHRRRLSEIRQARKDYEEETKQLEKLLETLKKTILQMGTRERRFEMLCEKYEQYETDRASLLRLEQDQEQLTGRQNTLMASIEELREQKAGLQMQIRDCQEQVTSFQKKVEKFANYAETDVLKQEEITDPARLEARYRALTEEISKSIKEFQGDQEWLQDTIHKKKEDLDRKNEDGRIPASAYENLIFSEEQYDNWTRQRKQAEKEWKKVKLLQEKLDEKNMANVAVMYQKAVEGNFFQTPVGMAYLLKLRQLLRENGYEDMKAEKQIKCLLQSIEEKKDDAVEERLQKRDAIWKSRLDMQQEKEAELQQRCKKLKCIAAMLAVLVIVLFAISLTGKNPTIINYRSKIVNQYASWEQELKEREAVVREKEAQLGITE